MMMIPLGIQLLRGGVGGLAGVIGAVSVPAALRLLLGLFGGLGGVHGGGEPGVVGPRVHGIRRLRHLQGVLLPVVRQKLIQVLAADGLLNTGLVRGQALRQILPQKDVVARRRSR